MIDDYSYAALLRSIGQMLEALRIDAFSVKSDSEGFIVRDKTRNRAQVTPRERAFLAELHTGHAPSLDKEDALRLAEGVLEWHLTEVDIERYETQARQRRQAVAGVPDSHSLSQILRVVGSIVDQKGGQLSSLAKDEQVVTVTYDLPEGKSASEEFSVPMLYDRWVRMYKKRSSPTRTQGVTT